jgi:iron complex transport system substrate-binding protein
MKRGNWIHRPFCCKRKTCGDEETLVKYIYSACLWLMSLSALAASPPQRVASLNLCADQLLIALAHPDQIVSLSPLSHDKQLSHASERAKAFPQNIGRGEAMLLQAPDLVLVGPFEQGARRDMLARHNINTHMLPPWTSFAMGQQQITDLSIHLGREAEGGKLNTALKAALERTRSIAPKPLRTLVLQKRSYTPGETSLLQDMLRHIGFVPYAEAYGLTQGGTLALEQLIHHPPDLLLMGEGDQQMIDQGSAVLSHPALNHLFPASKRLIIPDVLTLCGGPGTIEALDQLARQVREKIQ